MAAIEIVTGSIVPGLHVAPSVDDLKNSALCWNSLPESLKQSDVLDQHLNNLAEIFGRHGAQKWFAMHLIHRHDAVENGEVMIRTKLKTLTGSWSLAMDILHLDLSNIHAHILKLDSDGRLLAYVYSVGPRPNLARVPPAFFSELFGYLQDNKLTDLLGLEVIETMEPLVEFDLGDNGTVMLKLEQARYGKIFKETGFFYREGEDGFRQLKGNTSHAETTTPGVHKVFIDGKLKDEAGLVKALQKLGLIGDE